MQNLSLISAFLLLNIISLLPAANGTLPGTGTAADPYLIEDLADFDTFSDQANASLYWSEGTYARLITNIDLSGRTYDKAVIAPDTDNALLYYQGSSYKGIFDGGNHTVNNIVIDCGGLGNDYVGLFGQISDNACIKNLSIANVDIYSYDSSTNYGAIVGENDNSTISNCNSSGHIQAEQAGGICGSNSGTITNCSSTCSIFASDAGGICSKNRAVITGCTYLGSIKGGGCGGICAINTQNGFITMCQATVYIDAILNSGGLCGSNSATITSCFATGSIYSDSKFAENIGGFCGENYSGHISNCYTICSVSVINGTDFVGGFCGKYTNSLETGMIDRCYSAGAISFGGDNGSYNGGFFGGEQSVPIAGCFWDVDKGGLTFYYQNNSPAISISTFKLKDIDTFNYYNDASIYKWDFTDTDGDPAEWQMIAGLYPRLAWEDVILPIPGSGTASDPYIISDINGFNAFAESIQCWKEGVHTILNSDIDLQDIQYNASVIANNYDYPYQGVFDGNGHIIKNLNVLDGHIVSLFGYVGEGGHVKNLGVKNVTLFSTMGNGYTAGIIGVNYGIIEKCYSSGSVWGIGAGGIVGFNNGGIVRNCYSICSVGSNWYLGAGLVAYNSSGTIVNNYFAGSISSENIGSCIVGSSNGGTINNNFWDVETTGIGVSGDVILGAIGKSTAEMQDINTFLAAGWDFFGEQDNGSEDIWLIDGYPVLASFQGGAVVPNFTDLSLAEVQVILSDSDLTLGYINYLASDSIPSGQVISQYPSKSAIIFDEKVHLTISSGPSVALSGQGTESDPYLISSEKEFDSFVNNSDYWASGIYVQLTTDLDLSPSITGRSVYFDSPVAPDTDSTSAFFQGISYNGILKGNNHTISNLTIDTLGADKDYLGLFGYLGPTAQISDLTLDYATINTGQRSYYIGPISGFIDQAEINNCSSICTINGSNGADFIGGLCGQNHLGIITNCYSTPFIFGGQHSRAIGGICGQNSEGVLSNCNSVCSIIGSSSLGGLCGINSDGYIDTSFAAGSIKSFSDSKSIGGLCGHNEYASIENCYSSVIINSTDTVKYLGGLCGDNVEGIISNCYSTGSIAAQNGLDTIGGLCGRNHQGFVENSFWDIDSSGLPISDGGIGQTTAQMQDIAVYTSSSWDFTNETANGTEDLWTISTGNYPTLNNNHRDLIQGTGTFDQPYLIQNYADFIIFSNTASLWTKDSYVKLTTDLELSGNIYSSAVIAPDYGADKSFFQGLPYNGIFDGGSHTIANLTVDTANADNDYLGLFGKLASDAKIQNLKLKNYTVISGNYSYYIAGLAGFSEGIITNCSSIGSIYCSDSSDYAGGLCGENYNGLIEDSYSISEITGGSHSNAIGGLCGQNSEGAILDSYSICELSGASSLGGLCGINSDGTIDSCYAAGHIDSLTNSKSIGGLCGHNEYADITNCYSSCNISNPGNSSFLGGLCGDNTEGVILTCYSIANVQYNSSSENIGVLCGKNYMGQIDNSFWKLSMTDAFTSDGGTGHLMHVLQTQSTYTDSGWDFVEESANGTDDLWRMPYAMPGYPILAWQKDIPGDYNGPYGVDMLDFSELADNWLDTYDLPDLQALTQHWLAQ